MRMSYRQYKQHYSDCKARDYNASDKTIEVDIPYGRMKTSGVRSKKYDMFTLKATDGENVGAIEYKATCKDNALKQHKKYCAENGLTPVADETMICGKLREWLRFQFVVSKCGKEVVKLFRGFTLDEAIENAKKWCKQNGYTSSYNTADAEIYHFKHYGEVDYSAFMA